MVLTIVPIIVGNDINRTGLRVETDQPKNNVSNNMTISLADTQAIAMRS